MAAVVHELRGEVQADAGNRLLAVAQFRGFDIVTERRQCHPLAQLAHDQRDLLHIHLVAKRAHQKAPILEREFGGTEVERFHLHRGELLPAQGKFVGGSEDQHILQPVGLRAVFLFERADFGLTGVGRVHRDEFGRVVLALVIVEDHGCQRRGQGVDAGERLRRHFHDAAHGVGLPCTLHAEQADGVRPAQIQRDDLARRLAQDAVLRRSYRVAEEDVVGGGWVIGNW